MEYYIYQIGAGGVGGWLIPHVAKCLNEVSSFYGLNVRYIIFDPDYVEPQNIKRQNFIKQDIGKNKAEVLANRYKLLYNNISYVDDIFTVDLLDSRIADNDSIRRKIIIIGAIDNLEARRGIYEKLDSMKKDPQEVCSRWYIDLGNKLDSGQIYNTILTDKALVAHPEFIKMVETKTKKKKKEPSCEFYGEQSHSINNLLAAQCFSMLVNFFLNKQIKYLKLTVGNSGLVIPEIFKGSAPLNFIKYFLADICTEDEINKLSDEINKVIEKEEEKEK